MEFDNVLDPKPSQDKSPLLRQRRGHVDVTENETANNVQDLDTNNQHDKDFLEKDIQEKRGMVEWDLGMSPEEEREYRNLMMADSLEGSRSRGRLVNRQSTLEALFAGSYRVIMVIVMAFLLKSVMKRYKQDSKT